MDRNWKREKPKTWWDEIKWFMGLFIILYLISIPIYLLFELWFIDWLYKLAYKLQP